jgi:hypothetical protein
MLLRMLGAALAIYAVVKGGASETDAGALISFVFMLLAGFCLVIENKYESLAGAGKSPRSEIGKYSKKPSSHQSHKLFHRFKR